MRLKKIKSAADVCLMVVADRITPGFAEQITRHDGRFAQRLVRAAPVRVLASVRHGPTRGPAAG
jgi:hypothetical protein